MPTRPTTFSRIFDVPTPTRCPVCGGDLVTVDKPTLRSWRDDPPSHNVPKHLCAACGVFVVLHRPMLIRISPYMSAAAVKIAKAWNRELARLLSAVVG